LIEAIAKIKLNDKATWVNSDPIAVSAGELLKYGKRLENFDYFSQKTILVLSIIPDDFDFSYVELLEGFFKKVKDKKNLILTSSDCACYQDKQKWCDEELDYLMVDNKELLENYPFSIGLLKGYDADSYEKVRKSLEKKVQNYLVYISGESRSNPRYFSLSKFFQEKFPSGLDKSVYLHGCSLKQMQDIPKLNITMKGIITAGHITEAIYRGNPHYKRETRIKSTWNKWEQAIKSVV